MNIQKLLSLTFAVLLILITSCKKDKEVNVNSTTIASPNDFLSSARYDKLNIQIQAVSGYELTEQATNALVAFLQQRLNKPVGIQVIKSSIPSPGKSIYTVDDLKAVESAHRTEYTQGSTLSAYILVVDGPYSGDQANSKVLGITYSNTSMALFENTIRSFTGGVGQPSLATMETTSMEHEFGHVMGLVNNGTAMQSAHQDVANGKHCNNSNCLMYYNIESSASVANIFGGGIPSLDSNCINDLRANGGK